MTRDRTIIGLGVLWIILATAVLGLLSIRFEWQSFAAVYLAWAGGVITTLLYQKVRKLR